MGWMKWLQLLKLGTAVEKMEQEIKSAAAGQQLATGDVLALRVFGRRLWVGLTLKVQA